MSNWNQNQNNGNYNNSNNRNFQNRQNQRDNTPIQYKKSGATYSKIKNGKFEGNIIVNAWRKTKFGLMTAKVAPYSGASGKGLEIVGSESKSGKINEYQKMICTITHTATGSQNIYPVLMNIKSQVIVISELGLCITPNGIGVTSGGKKVTGYFGKFTR